MMRANNGATIDKIALASSPSNELNSGHATLDDELAKEQLIAESHSDVFPSMPPPSSRPSSPPPAAVLGASLLNSARVDRNHSSNTGGSMGRKNRVGMLKRRTLIPENSKTNLAIRGDVYDIEDSPVKGSYALPEKVNQNPLRVVKKKKQAARKPSADLPVALDLRVRNADEPDSNQEVSAENLISSPRIDSSGSNATKASSSGAEAHANTTENVIIEESFRNGKLRCTAVLYRFDKAGSGYKQCARSGTGRTGDVVRCATHIRKAPTVRCGMMTSEEGDTQCLRVATMETTHGARCSVHAEDEQPIKEMRLREKRKSASVHEEDQPAKLPRRRRQDKHESTLIVTSQDSHPASRNSADDEDPDYQPDAEEDERAIPPDAGPAPVVERATSIEAVFRFLNIEEHPGRCVTKSARSLIRQCEKSLEQFQDDTTSTETIVNDAADIQEKLRSFSSTVSEERRLIFKSDAFGHVFHSLVRYLRALHDWLLKGHESVTESLEALRIITPLLHAIVTFKDTITEWNATVPQRCKGDRPIKDVESHLIAPLRQVEKAFSAHLSRLEEVEQRREMTRRMEEQIEAEYTRIEATEAMQERKKRWQSLHIVRMQCEPDIYQRRKLFHTRFEDLVERDANGVVFERLPLFKSRSAPPHSRISEIADETEWTEKEETAVLEGLRQYAGPYVFEKMFKMYCDPRSRHPRAGDLRSRSVAEIVSKARWIQSAMLVLCQETGEPLEEWVNKIPVLP